MIILLTSKIEGDMLCHSVSTSKSEILADILVQIYLSGMSKESHNHVTSIWSLCGSLVHKAIVCYLYFREASERDLGGGYMTELGCYRALQDAFSGLYFTYDIVRNITSPRMDVS